MLKGFIYRRISHIYNYFFLSFSGLVKCLNFVSILLFKIAKIGYNNTISEFVF